MCVCHSVLSVESELKQEVSEGYEVQRNLDEQANNIDKQKVCIGTHMRMSVCPPLSSLLSLCTDCFLHGGMCVG